MNSTAPKPASNETPWLAQGGEKRRVVQSMFAEIAPAYDRMNRLMTANLDRAWRRAAVRAISPKNNEFALDLCCGTGDFIPLLRESGAKVLGIDFCYPMLDRARDKAESVLALGDACQIPVQANAVDVVTVGWGIRNVPDIDLAHREIFRVLKPGGRFVSLDMAIPENGLIRSISGFVTLKVLPKLGAMLSQAKAYQYLPESTQRFKTRNELKKSMEDAGFEDVRMKDFAMGNVCMHWGRKP